MTAGSTSADDLVAPRKHARVLSPLFAAARWPVIPRAIAFVPAFSAATHLNDPRALRTKVTT
jgi:hypothetical protein